jgi:hypothetical protein
MSASNKMAGVPDDQQPLDDRAVEILSKLASVSLEIAGADAAQFLPNILSGIGLDLVNKSRDNNAEPATRAERIALSLPDSPSAKEVRWVDAIDKAVGRDQSQTKWIELWVKAGRPLVKAHLVSCSELKRKWRVQTMKDAKSPESPESKISRFLGDLGQRLLAGDPELEAALPPYKCRDFTTAMWSLLTHPLGDERREAFQMLALGSPGEFLDWSLFLQGRGLDEVIVPRAWADPLEKQWREWVRVDARAKAQRATQGRSHDETGRFTATRRQEDKTFTSGHPKKFKKIND